MFAPSIVILAMFAYIATLFVLAQIAERTAFGRKLANHPVTYALGLAVYCTTWTYYGSVGKAVTGGMGYLPVYLGPTLALLVGGAVFKRIAQLKHAHRITSIADFISARFAKSQAVAATVTAILTIGIIPYIALQLKAANQTFAMLVAGGAGGAGGEASALAQWFGPISVMLMIVFTIVFGIRHLDPTERHPGMVVSLAAESFVKLVAFIAAGAFVVGAAFHGYSGFEQALGRVASGSIPLMGQSSNNDTLTYVTVMLLSMAAFAFLPRQFHVGIVENNRASDIKTAQWLTPLYLVLINLFVVPIALGGKLLAQAGTSADFYVLALPLQAGKSGLSMAVFLGGFSAAIGMIMIESMTMATMISNHLLLPAVQLVKPLHFMRRHVLFMRWAAAAGFILGGHLFAVKIGSSYPLVSIGLISFAAAFVLAPVVLLGLYWSKANRAGALLGLCGGAGVWFYTLMVPTFVKAGWVDKTLLSDGPIGIALLRPEALFGWVGLPSLAHGVMWSSLATLLGLIGGSACFRSSKEEALLTAAFLGDASEQLAHLDASGKTIDVEAQLEKVRALIKPYFSVEEAETLLSRALEHAGARGEAKMTVMQSAEFVQEVERMLAGALGAASAHGVMKAFGGFERKDKATLQREFARALASLNMSPKDLRARIDFQKERERLLEEQFHALEQKIKERDTEIIERRKAEVALQHAHDELEQRVIERTKELRAILDNVVFGFIVIDEEMVVQPGFTQSCRLLLGTDHIAGRKLPEILALSEAESITYGMNVQQIFEDLLPESLSIDQLPQRFVTAGARVLRIEPRLVRNDDGQPAVLLLTISDVTQLEDARRENENNRALLNILRQKPAFELFLDETKEQLRSARKVAEQDEVLVRRVAHTIKGNVALYGLSPIARLIHEIEEQPNIEGEALDTIADAFREFLASHTSVLGLNFDQGPARSFVLTQAQLDQLRDALRSSEGVETSKVAQIIREIEGVPASDLLGPMDRMAQGLAERLGKKVAFEMRGTEVRVDRARMAPLFQVLPHLVRNAIDHGVEPDGERGDKLEHAKVRVEITETEKHYLVSVTDDGRGINTNAVLRSAVAKGLVTDAAAQTMAEPDVHKLIFADNLSTAATVTDVSGRGVGLSAVKAEVERLGGDILIDSELGQGTRFQLIVPKLSSARTSYLPRRASVRVPRVEMGASDTDNPSGNAKNRPSAPPPG